MANQRTPRTFSFVIKLWKLDQTRFGLRGRITYVNEAGLDEARDFTKLQDVNGFIGEVLNKNGIQTRASTSFWEQWLFSKKRR